MFYVLTSFLCCICFVTRSHGRTRYKIRLMRMITLRTGHQSKSDNQELAGCKGQTSFNIKISKLAALSKLAVKKLSAVRMASRDIYLDAPTSEQHASEQASPDLLQVARLSWSAVSPWKPCSINNDCTTHHSTT